MTKNKMDPKKVETRVEFEFIDDYSRINPSS